MHNALLTLQDLGIIENTARGEYKVNRVDTL